MSYYDIGNLFFKLEICPVERGICPIGKSIVTKLFP